jgi:hypothetical protein
MANEGIMAAPMPMQQQQQQQPPQGYVSSLDAYNAASSAMQETNPEEFNQYKAAISQKLGALNLKSSEIESFVTLLEYMMQYPDQYKEVIRAGIEAGAIEEGDFPAEFDQGFITTMLAALNEQRIQQVQNVSPEAMGPGPQEPMAMKSGGLADAAKALQARGRGRDTILAHINPQEAEMLRKAGGLGTTNPYTGLKEYGWLNDTWNGVKGVAKGVGDAVKSVASSPIGRIALGIGLTMALGPAGLNLGLGLAGTGAVVGGGIAALGGGSFQDVLKGAALGYIGGTVSPSISGYMPGAAGSVLNQGFTGAALGTGFGLATGMSAKDALKAGAIGGVTAAGVGYGQQEGYIPGGRVDLSTDPADLATMEKLGTNGIPITEDLSINPVEPVGDATSNLPAADNFPSAETIPVKPPTSMSTIQGVNASQSSTNGLTPVMRQDALSGQQFSINVGGDNYLVYKDGAGNNQYVRADAIDSSQPMVPISASSSNVPSNQPGRFGTDSGVQTSPAPSAMNDASAQFGTEIGGSRYGGPAPVVDRSTMSPSAMYERASDVVTGGYDEYFSPNRPSMQQGEQNALLKADQAQADYMASSPKPTEMGADAAWKAAYESNSPGFISKYLPLAAAGLGATYLAGGFEAPPADDKPVYDPAYTGTEYIRDNPQAFSGSLYNYQSQGAGAYDPSRVTTYEGGQGAVAPGVVTPTGIMQAQYSPEYGRRRTQALQRYYSPFIGTAAPIMAAKGGSIREFPRKSGPINGPGTGTSDDIPAMLSDGEFVFTARAVRNAGNGSRRKGAARMYKLMKSLEKGGMVKG